MGMLDDVPNSAWGNCTSFKTAELIALAASTRPRDIFHFVQEKPADQRFPVTKDGRLVGWVATPEESRHSKLADVVTLDLWTEVKDSTSFQNLNSGINLWAEVEWGSGGTCITARVDIRRGTQITVPADCITVRLGCDAMPVLEGELDTPWEPLPVDVNCLVGKGSAPSSWKAQRGIYVPVVASTSASVIRIPDFASGIRVAALRSSVTNAAITVEVLQNSSLTPIVYESWTALMLKDSPFYFPLPNGAEYVRLTNGTATALENVTLEFNLSM